MTRGGGPPSRRDEPGDALRALARLGCGEARLALGRMTGRRFDLDSPEVWAAGPAEAASRRAPWRGELLAVGMRLSGLLEGALVLAWPEEAAAELAAALGQPMVAEEPRPKARRVPGASGARRPWGPLAESALLEASNVAGSAFASALAEREHGKILLSVPALARGEVRVGLEALIPGARGPAIAARLFSPGDDAFGAAPLEVLVLFFPAARRGPALPVLPLSREGETG